MFVTKRHIQPGYDIGECSPEYAESIFCTYANEVYNKFLTKKQGIDVCFDDNFQKYSIKKQILDLTLLYDPAYCACPTCLPPCNVIVEGTVFDARSCAPPRAVNVTGYVVVIPCNPPTNIQATFNYII